MVCAWHVLGRLLHSSAMAWVEHVQGWPWAGPAMIWEGQDLDRPWDAQAMG
jgi:hypothetical protein